jgi:hypothetical protein
MSIAGADPADGMSTSTCGAMGIPPLAAKSVASLQAMHRPLTRFAAALQKGRRCGTPSRPRLIVALRPRLKMRLRADGVYIRPRPLNGGAYSRAPSSVGRRASSRLSSLATHSMAFANRWPGLPVS